MFFQRSKFLSNCMFLKRQKEIFPAFASNFVLIIQVIEQIRTEISET